MSFGLSCFHSMRGELTRVHSSPRNSNRLVSKSGTIQTKLNHFSLPTEQTVDMTWFLLIRNKQSQVSALFLSFLSREKRGEDKINPFFPSKRNLFTVFYMSCTLLHFEESSPDPSCMQIWSPLPFLSFWLIYLNWNLSVCEWHIFY